MSFIDDAKAAAIVAVPGHGAPEDAQAAFDAMPMAELAARWRMQQFVGIKQQTEGTWAAARYLDSLPHEQPRRAYEMVLAVLAAETDLSVRLRLHDVFSTLIHAHGALLVDRIVADTTDNAALRWLLGGGCWWTQDKAMEARLEAVADVDAFRADYETHKTRNEPVDFDALSIDELARVWIEQTDKPFKDHDHNWQDFQDYQRELIEYDPEFGNRPCCCRTQDRDQSVPAVGAGGGIAGGRHRHAGDRSGRAGGCSRPAFPRASCRGVVFAQARRGEGPPGRDPRAGPDHLTSWSDSKHSHPRRRMISRRRFLQWLLSLGVVGAAASAYGVVVEPLLRQRVTRYDVKLRRWPDDLPLTIAAIADVHACKPWMTIERIHSIVRQTNELKPDVIVLLGDYVAGLRYYRTGEVHCRGMVEGSGRTEGAARRSCHSWQPRLVGRPCCTGEWPRPDHRRGWRSSASAFRSTRTTLCA